MSNSRHGSVPAMVAAGVLVLGRVHPLLALSEAVLTQLRDRLQVLERIAVEKENSLEREIESLRDR